jgi:hypothetical protein
MSAIKPFKAIESPQRNKLATRKWTTKFLRMVLGKLNITGQGIAIKQTGDGHLHFELENGEATTCTHAFKLSVSPDLTGIIVSPGEVAVEGSPRIPTINGRAIDDTQGTLGPPVLVPPLGIGYVWVKALMRPVLNTFTVGNVSLSYLRVTQWSDSSSPIIEAGLTLPTEIPAEIGFDTGVVTTATSYTAIGRYSRTAENITILDTRWITNISMVLNGQGRVFKSAF